MQNGVLIVDALSAGTGRRTSSRDSIGCGPRSVAGVLERHEVQCRIARVENLLSTPGQMKSFQHIAISAMTMDLPVVKTIATKWKKTNTITSSIKVTMEKRYFLKGRTICIF